MSRPVLVILAALTLVWSFAGLAVAGESDKGQAQVDLSIRVIYAAKSQSPSVDPALADIRDELKDLPASKFRLLDRLQAQVDIKGTAELQLPGDHAIAVRFLGIDKSKGKQMLSLQLSMKPALKISLRLADGGRTLLGGPKHLDGKLVLDISAQLKEAKK